MHKSPLPRLEIVSQRSLILHEDVEGHRVDKIMARFKKERFLKNPPIVGQNPKYRRLIVLDGASRVTAARRMGFPHFLVQIVPYPSPSIGLDRWHHMVVGMHWEALLEQVKCIPGIRVETMPWSRASRGLEERKILACLRSPGRRAVALRVHRPRVNGLQPIRELTRIYATDPGLHRVREDEVVFPREWLGEERVLVLFPRYTQEDIVRFALRLRDRLPMGITRHTVPNRALRVFFPLHRLRNSRTLVEKRRFLKKFMEDSWEAGRIRHYPEPTTVYDE